MKKFVHIFRDRDLLSARVPASVSVLLTTIIFGFGSIFSPVAVATPLAPDFVSSLDNSIALVAARDVEFQKLLQESLARMRVKTARELLTRIQICEGSSFEAGRVTQNTRERFVILLRDFEEPKNQSEAERQRFYSQQISGGLQRFAEGNTPTRWTFGDDVITVSAFHGDRSICLRSNLLPAQALFALAHELVHFARTQDPAMKTEEQVTSDFHRLSNQARTYAIESVLAPGDEVDAYTFENALRIRLYGKQNLSTSIAPNVLSLFDDRGGFIGSRPSFANLILDDWHYYENHFAPEFRSYLEERVHVLTEKKSMMGELSTEREKELAHYNEFLKTRWKWAGWILKDYKKETDRVSTLAQETSDSIVRMTRLSEAYTSELKLSQDRLQAFRSSAPTLTK